MLYTINWIYPTYPPRQVEALSALDAFVTFIQQIYGQLEFSTTRGPEKTALVEGRVKILDTEFVYWIVQEAGRKCLYDMRV